MAMQRYGQGYRSVELQDLQTQLRALRRQCRPVRADKACGILDGLGQGAAGSSRKQRSVAHVRGTHRG